MEEKQHKRRVRYSGKYQKKFEEKYKEHNPEKYADTINHVIEKGSTPAGMHISIMVKEILDFLQIKPGQQGLDATLGYGGHTTAMLKCLEGKGHIYALDVDPIESAKTKERLASRGFGEDIVTVKCTCGRTEMPYRESNILPVDISSPYMKENNFDLLIPPGWEKDQRALWNKVGRCLMAAW